MRHKDFKDKYGVHNLLVCKIKDPSYKKDFFVYYTESGIAWSAGEELDSYEDKDVEEDYGDVNFEVVDWFDETNSSVEEEHNPEEKCIFNGCEARVNYVGFCNGCAHDLTMAREKGQTVVNEIAISIIPQQRRCECGSEACGYTTHSTWCPKHV